MNTVQHGHINLQHTMYIIAMLPSLQANMLPGKLYQPEFQLLEIHQYRTTVLLHTANSNTSSSGVWCSELLNFVPCAGVSAFYLRTCAPFGRDQLQATSLLTTTHPSWCAASYDHFSFQTLNLRDHPPTLRTTSAV